MLKTADGGAILKVLLIRCLKISVLGTSYISKSGLGFSHSVFNF